MLGGLAVLVAIAVELVLEQLSYNLDVKELFAAYPCFTDEDVKACIAFVQETVRPQQVGPRVTSNSTPPRLR